MKRKKITKVEDVKVVVEKVVEDITSNQNLMEKLRKLKKWQDRRFLIDKYVLDNMKRYKEFGLDSLSWFFLWISQFCFYEIQKKNKIDFGYCEYMEPGWWKVVEGFLKKEHVDLVNYCNYESKTYCTFRRECCPKLNPIKDERRLSSKERKC